MQIPAERKPDSLDLQAMQDTVSSRSFERIRTRIGQELARHQAVCENSPDPIEIHRAQGAIAAIRTALKIPEILIAEMKSPEKKNAAN